MSPSTPATLLLARAGAAFTLHAYGYDPRGEAKGLQAAHALGVAPAAVFKTLMIVVDGAPACAMLASDRALSLKHAAAALGGRKAAMMPAAQAERLSGYHVGGISPFAQRRIVPAVLDKAAMALPAIYLNAGRRGLQLLIAPADVVHVLGCTVAPVAA